MSKRVRPPRVVATSQPAGDEQGFPGTSTALSPGERRRRELGGFPARFLTSLPASATMFCLTASGTPFVVTTCMRDWQVARAHCLSVFDGDEWAALLLGAQQERAAPAALEQWLHEKQSSAAWELTPLVAVGAIARIEPAPRTPLAIAAVLRAYGATLVLVPETCPAAAADWSAAR